MSSSLYVTLLDNVVYPYQRFLGSIGIDSSLKLGLVASVLTATTLYLIKPNFAYDEQTGEARPWTFLTDDDNSGVTPTNVPWYVVSGGVGYTLYLIG